MYAVIETGGKQLKVEEGQTIWVENLMLRKVMKLFSIKYLS